MTTQDEPLTIAAAARALGKDRATVRRWINAGFLHAVPNGPHRQGVPVHEIERVKRLRRGEES